MFIFYTNEFKLMSVDVYMEFTRKFQAGLASEKKENIHLEKLQIFIRECRSLLSGQG